MVARDLEKIRLIDYQTVESVYNILNGDELSVNNWEKGINAVLAQALIENPHEDFSKIEISKIEKE